MMLRELIENFLNLYSSDDDSDAVERVSEREIILHESYVPERITINTNIGGASAGWRRKTIKAEMHIIKSTLHSVKSDTKSTKHTALYIRTTDNLARWYSPLTALIMHSIMSGYTTVKKNVES